MLTPCPRCGRNVVNGMDVPTGSLHTCCDGQRRGTQRGTPSMPLGQCRECICGAPIYQDRYGHKWDRDGEPHYCGEWLLTTCA